MEISINCNAIIAGLFTRLLVLSMKLMKKHLNARNCQPALNAKAFFLILIF